MASEALQTLVDSPQKNATPGVLTDARASASNAEISMDARADDRGPKRDSPARTSTISCCDVFRAASIVDAYIGT